MRAKNRLEPWRPWERLIKPSEVGPVFKQLLNSGHTVDYAKAVIVDAVFTASDVADKAIIEAMLRASET